MLLRCLPAFPHKGIVELLWWRVFPLVWTIPWYRRLNTFSRQIHGLSMLSGIFKIRHLVQRICFSVVDGTPSGRRSLVIFHSAQLFTLHLRMVHWAFSWGGSSERGCILRSRSWCRLTHVLLSFWREGGSVCILSSRQAIFPRFCGHPLPTNLQPSNYRAWGAVRIGKKYLMREKWL